MLPEWLWALIVGSILLALIGYIWNTRNQGYLTSEDHEEHCGKVKKEMCIDIDKVADSFGKTINDHYQNFQLLLNAKFENLDEKIENKVLKELKLISNVNSHSKSKSRKKS
jgi:hypothetical protein